MHMHTYAYQGETEGRKLPVYANAYQDLLGLWYACASFIVVVVVVVVIIIIINNNNNKRAPGIRYRYAYPGMHTRVCIDTVSFKLF